MIVLKGSGALKSHLDHQESTLMKGLTCFSQEWVSYPKKRLFLCPPPSPPLADTGDPWPSTFHHEHFIHVVLMRSQADPNTWLLSVPPTDTGAKVNLTSNEPPNL